MIGKSEGSDEVPSREKHRYSISLPIEIEIASGLFGEKKRLKAEALDLAVGGAACRVEAHKAIKVGRRFRLFIDGRPCFAEVRNIAEENGSLRVGLAFKKLELETQERIIDAIDQNKIDRSRLS